MGLDRRMRDGLRQEVDPLAPDTERRLREVRRRGGPGTGVGPWLVAVAIAIVVISGLALGVLPGIGPRIGSGPTQSPHASGRVRPSVPRDALTGTAWTVTLLPTDPGVSDLGMAGEWTMHLGDDASLVLQPPEGIRSPNSTEHHAAYAFTDEGLVTNLFAGSFATPCAGPGVYQVTVGTGELVLVGRDACEPRHALLATHPWTRAQ